MATKTDCKPSIPPGRAAMELYTADEVRALYGVPRSTLFLLAERGVLHRRTPRTLSRPVYYWGPEVRAAIAGESL